jgi:type VI secretion system protein ImpE
MTANDLFKAGKLDEAIKVLSAEVRDKPTDTKRRTFLFELLCFAGEFDRAEKQLNVLADEGKDTRLGAMLYFSALHGERLRLEQFSQNPGPATPPEKDFSGTINGQPFGAIEDADPRIGAKLDLFAAGAYLWIPFEHILSIEIQPPTRLRDLLWCPALVRTGPEFKDRELGEVLVPVLYPKSSSYPDDNVRLGRCTAWQEIEGEPVPFGQKMFLVDGEEFPLLEVRKLEFAAPQAATA